MSKCCCGRIPDCVSPTIITDTVHEPIGPGLFCGSIVLHDLRDWQKRAEKAAAELARVTSQLKVAREALEKLGNWRTPAVLGEGDYDRGLLCGVEDLDLQSLGYEAMRYGYDCAIERVGEEIDETIRAALAKPEQEGGE